MHFANPDMFYAVVLIPLLILVFVIAERKRAALVATFIDPRKKAMAMGASFERRLVYLVLLILGLSFLIVSAARPQWGSKLENMRARGIDILVAIDVSESMRATDVSPSRMAKARQTVEKFLGMLSGDRVGLIAFAGSAYTYCPLTVDYSAVRLFLDSMEPGIIADGGTNFPAVIEEAIDTFERAESPAKRVLVIFSDGENHEGDPLPAVMKAVDENIQIFTVGIGNSSAAGERIPVESNDNQSFKLDDQGNLVITKLDEVTLQEVAQAGGGDYYRTSDAGLEMVRIYQTLEEKEETEFASRMQRQREDRYQLFLLAAFLLLTAAYSLSNRSFKRLRRSQEVRA
jgi:Ca-activated chloride channel family protein